MATPKTKTAYMCSSCGYDSPKWLGKCPSCGEWNTFVEERVPARQTKGARGRLVKSTAPVRLSEIEVTSEQRMRMPSEELNRVLGGGLVAGSLTLIGGEPGIGKSTLLLQNILSIRNRRILYVSGEESASQLRLRADRLGKVSDNTFILCETALDAIFTHIENVKPELLAVDSIQTICSADIESAAGSVSQVRECAASLLRYAKESGVPVILVGHINKDGAIAGRRRAAAHRDRTRPAQPPEADSCRRADGKPRSADWLSDRKSAPSSCRRGYKRAHGNSQYADGRGFPGQGAAVS